MENSATGPGATLARLWAVALLTFKEAIRRKIFLIVLIFAVALVGSAPFLPAMTGESRLRLLEVWSVRAAFIFSLILAVFLAGFSIPGDVETRRIYTLVSKPIHKVTIFFGKFLGFVLMIAAFLGSTGVITLVYVRTVAAVSKKTGDPKMDFPPLRVEPRFNSSVRVANGYSNEELGAAKIIGGETPPGVLLWEFKGLDAAAFEPDVKARLKVDLGRVDKPYEIEGQVQVTVRNAKSEWTSEVLTIQTNQEKNWSFPREMIVDGGVIIELRTTDPGLKVIAKSDRVVQGSTAPRAMVLFGRSELFELTFFKGLLLVLFQSMVVLAITLSASACLTAPVSILLGILVFFLGWFWPFLSESVRDVDTDLAAFRAQLEGHHEGDGHDHGPPTMVAPPWLMKWSSRMSKVVLKLVPNFDLFNMSDYLLKDLAVMGRDLVDGFLAMLPRVAVLLLVGILAMWLRDFST